MPDPAAPVSPIRLVISDVDGTLVTNDKLLTPRARDSVRRLLDAGIVFTITSGRPPLGMKMLVDALSLSHPVAAFNGGLIVAPDLAVLREHCLPAAVLPRAFELLRSHGLDIWVYRGHDWFVHERHGPHVDREEWTVKFAPTVVPDVTAVRDRVVKVVGVSDDFDAVARCEADMRRDCGAHLSAARSQPYYLDITHPDANKGTVVTVMSELLGVPAAQIAGIGDGPNDILMFQRAGLSIAMGNASAQVQGAARFVTASNQEDGFALAMERYILSAARG